MSVKTKGGGFFNATHDIPGNKKTTKSKEKIYDCSKCKLNNGRVPPEEKYLGKGRLGILIISGDEKAQFSGASYTRTNLYTREESEKLLREVLEVHGYDLDADFYRTNTLICKLPVKVAPTINELKCCRINWEGVIEETKPKAIWLLGGAALDAFYTNRIGGKSDLSIGSWRRWCIPDKKTAAWVLPLFHPSVMGKWDRDGIIQNIFINDIRWAVYSSKKQFPKFRDYSKVNTLTKYDEAMEYLSSILNGSLVTLDYETTGLKPYKMGHKILTVAVKRLQDDCAMAFPLQWKNFWGRNQKQIEEKWKEILTNPKIEKVAQNIKFEHNWSRAILKVEVQGWVWDTMINQHLLDTRPGLSGLKTQAFLRFGVENYDERVRAYIEAADSNALNRLEEAPLEDVLQYNGMDTNIEEALYLEQKKKMNGSLGGARELFHEGILAFADMEFDGIRTDEEYYRDARSKLSRRMGSMKRRLVNSEEAGLFKEHTGYELNLNSTKHLSTLFYDVLKEEPVRYTAKAAKPSMDEMALTNFTSGFARKLLRLKKLDKLEGTFLKGFEQESFGGYIHPFFNLHIARSGRSSSDSPNFQNIPKRNKEAMMMVRKGIIPRPGYELIGADYKQMEVYVQAFYSNDQAMIQYVVDKDMHTESAMEIFMLPKERISKALRHLGKNGFNFPEIYGDWYKSIAKALWEEVIDGVTDVRNGSIADHLMKKGIEDYSDFENHIKAVEENFWSKFQATREWRDEQVELYKRRGYVDTFFGFRRNGYLRRNEVCNTPVQGTAFHCLLWSLIEITKIKKRENWNTKVIGQIHDQIIFDVDPKEKRHVVETVENVMCNEIMKGRPWITIPLKVDFEYSGVDQPWAYSEG